MTKTVESVPIALLNVVVNLRHNRVSDW